MIRPAALLAGLVALGCALPDGAARAETMITSLSTHRLQISSNFVGSEIVLFGAIERDAQTISRTGTYDIAVVVRGPRGTVVTREKTRVLGIWMNTRSRQFIDVPTAYSVVSNRPVADMADLDLRKRQQIGLDGLILLQTARLADEGEPGQPFRDAFVRINQTRGLYRENPTGVTFLTPMLFRANIRVVPNTPVGNFDVDIFLLSGGAILARESTNFEVTKTGFEAFVANAAQNYGLYYGLAAAFIALFTGWSASIIFRRD
jgi:uncharacterized protein (TIGR02186 family)